MAAKKQPYQPTRRNSIHTGKPGWKNLPRCETVGDLLKLLHKLPCELALASDVMQPVWFNVGSEWDGDNGEHLSFEEEWELRPSTQPATRTANCGSSTNGRSGVYCMVSRSNGRVQPTTVPRGTCPTSCCRSWRAARVAACVWWPNRRRER